MPSSTIARLTRFPPAYTSASVRPYLSRPRTSTRTFSPKAAQCLLRPVAESLLLFRGVNAVQPDLVLNLLAVQNRERVAVMHADNPPLDGLGLGTGDEQQDERGSDKQGFHVLGMSWTSWSVS